MKPTWNVEITGTVTGMAAICAAADRAVAR